MRDGTNLGVVAHAKGELRVDSWPEPVPAADEAVIEIAYGGICGSDLHYWMNGAAGESVLREPLLLGHEIVGTVLAAAQNGAGLPVGTRVAIHPAMQGSENGARYPHDRPNLAPDVTYLGSAARFPHRSGGFANRVAIPERMLRQLPDNLSLRDAAIVEPASVAWHAVSRAGDVTGKRALVIGCGPIGCLVIAVLRHHGASEIVAVDMFDGPLAIARASGATSTVMATDADAIAAVDADITVESSGSHRGLASAVRGTTRGGRVVMVGLLPSGEQPALVSLAITRELELVGSFRFNNEIDAVISALADGSLHTESVVTHEFPVADALEAFEAAKNSAVSGKVLLSFQ